MILGAASIAGPAIAEVSAGTGVMIAGCVAINSGEFNDFYGSKGIEPFACRSVVTTGEREACTEPDDDEATNPANRRQPFGPSREPRPHGAGSQRPRAVGDERNAGEHQPEDRHLQRDGTRVTIDELRKHGGDNSSRRPV